MRHGELAANGVCINAELLRFARNDEARDFQLAAVVAFSGTPEIMVSG